MEQSQFKVKTVKEAFNKKILYWSFNVITKHIEGGLVIDLLKIESAVTQMALRGASLEEIATHTKLKIQSIKKLLEFSKKRLSPFSYAILKDPSFE